jgi:GNAT superfamily N-acetyltransferase
MSSPRKRDPLVFTWEPLAALLDDGIAEMAAKHGHEVSIHQEQIPCDIDWEGYQGDEDRGFLHAISARRGDRLIGYAAYYIMFHRHYKSTLHAANTAIFIDPAERGAGIALIRAAERMLVALAAPHCIRILYHAKLHVEAERGTLSRVFEKLGYAAFETTHDKVVMPR